MRVSGVILAGGDSRRMGCDKATLVKGELTLLEMVRDRLQPHCCEILVVSRAERLKDLRGVKGVELVPDRLEIRGPLVGIQAGLLAAAADHAFVVGCDMPCLRSPAIRLLLDVDPAFDVVVPFLEGNYEPLFARYHRRCLPAVARALEGLRRSVPSFFDDVKVRRISRRELTAVDPSLESLSNLNTVEQWDDFTKPGD